MIAVDLDGALIDSRPFKSAHKKWFSQLSQLLEDAGVLAYAETDDYFERVDECMHRFLGNVSKEERFKYGRFFYTMLAVAEIKKADIAVEFVEFLKRLKQPLVVVTSFPEIGVKAILEKIGLEADIIGSALDSAPDKLDLFEKMEIKPKFYIGKADGIVPLLQGMGITTVTVSWFATGDHIGDYDVSDVRELSSVLSF